MSRIRTDNVFGTTTDNPLTNVATTMNSAGLANLAAVTAPDEAIIILDPNRLTGAPEIVVVTAHTGSATSATIVRGQFGTAARQHALGTEWVHGPIAGNTAAFTTAANDQGDFVPMAAWEAYTPTFGNTTVGNGAVSGGFVRVGRTIHFRARLLWGSTTAFTGTVDFTLPVNAATNLAAGLNNVAYQTSAWLLDSSARHFIGLAILGVDNGNTADASKGKVVHTESGNVGTVDATNPFTWATGDILLVGGSYEAAS